MCIRDRVNVGNENILQIVCGAPNVKLNQKVVVATVGTILHPLNNEKFKITKSKIRGEISQGMICAEDEIGIGNSHDGIIVLDAKYKPGTKISKIYENDGAVSGLTILNNELYFSDRDHNTINKLVFDGSSFSSEVVVGRRDNGGYHYSEFQMYNFSDDFPLYPGELVADQVNNRIYVNFYQI